MTIQHDIKSYGGVWLIEKGPISGKFYVLEDKNFQGTHPF